MKTTLVIQDGKHQVVLTPETEHETAVLKLIESKEVETTIKIGHFSECQGGWIRRYAYKPPYGDSSDDIDSLMIILADKAVKKGSD